ncbi:uncharacterized protein LOC128329109 [Hemicordylus capensis]|uniref:uncharacterized protein LOC128329109 n=1 Tax=Hemicordylus capensis TaxID=884348 RepID=UPI00230354FB|nr:uncharacterized protein LOC128329109 [Hemicordylus capensis]
MPSFPPPSSEGPLQSQTPLIPDHPGGPVLATEAMVHRASQPHLQTPPATATATARYARPSATGAGFPSRSRLVKASRLETEWCLLKHHGYSASVLNTMLASGRSSTNWIYQSMWRAFLHWSDCHGVLRGSASVPHLLQFLQDGLDKGLSANTLKRQASSLVGLISGTSKSAGHCHPHLRRFLQGATLLSPPVVHHFPTWDLHAVLKALQGPPPFESLSAISLCILSLKLAFLVAITSACRVSELRALSVHKSLCIFSKDSVRLIPDPFFRPKVASPFHMSQDIVLPSFCPHPVDPTEKAWHKLDVRRCLKTYIRRTKQIRTSEALFMFFLPRSMGQPVTPATLAMWLKACISLAYESQGRRAPTKVLAHSTRSAATSAAFSTNAHIQDICRALTWRAPSTFTRHYKLDIYGSAQAVFGRRVLQQVLPAW